MSAMKVAELVFSFQKADLWLCLGISVLEH